MFPPSEQKTEIATPTVGTDPATNISTTSATLHGTVNPNGLSTTVIFEWGESTSYGNSVPAIPSPLTGTSPVSVSASITGLSPGTEYHFRVVATNSAGTTDGNDRTFMTSTQDTTFTRITTGDIVNDGGSSLGCSWGDYDNDGDIDLFVANNFGEDTLLYRNNGDSTFTKIMSGAIVNDGGKSYSGSWGDYDNDGDLDLFVANNGENNFLYRNNGDRSFTKSDTGKIINDGGNSGGSSWGDYDNDGDLDLFVANNGENNFLYRNNGDRSFTKIDSGQIVTDGGNSGGSSWGDYDNDGDLDLFVANFIDEDNFLYKNNGNDNSWINIKCVGSVSNTSAIGTKVRVKATIFGKFIWQMREISGQTGHQSQNSLNAEFGLGDATIIDSIKVEWPSGIVLDTTSVTVDQFLTITEKGSDNSPPKITHSAISIATSGQSQAISATLTDNISVQSATFFYGRGGDNYEATIPANLITERGAEYYFSVQDAVGNLTTFPETNPENSPQVIQVTSSNLFFSSPDMAYRIISMPIHLDNPSPAAVLEDEGDLGSYDKKQWRLYKSINGIKREYTVDDIGSFEPGAGFWLITRGSKNNLDTGSGESVTTAQNYSIILQPGWNQIGNPFAFTINWSDVIKKGDIDPVLVGYDGSSNENTSYDFTRTQLVPFEGYFVNNLESSETTLEIPPKAATVTAEQFTGLQQLFDLQSDEWALQLTAQSDRFMDKDNYIGVLNDASDKWDSSDFSEAPFFDKLVSLYFPHDDWSTYPGHYTGDFRSAKPGGHFWDFHVESNIPNSKVVLTLADLENVPSTWNITLLDKSGKTSINLLTQNTYSFPAGEHGTERHFRILVGDSDFTDNHDLGFSGVPQEFVLSQNYPNPFNPETHIDYELPSASDVKIAVYNLRGQRVRTLFNAKQSAGRYTVSWDGASENGLPVASGLYFLRMQAEEFVTMKKMILSK